MKSRLTTEEDYRRGEVKRQGLYTAGIEHIGMYYNNPEENIIKLDSLMTKFMVNY